MRSTLVVMLAALWACQSNDVSRAVGARCDNKDDCDDRCLTSDERNRWPGGFCTTTCANPSECDGDTACADIEGGVCLFQCGADQDCQFLGERWTCEEADLRGGGIKVKVCRGS